MLNNFKIWTFYCIILKLGANANFAHILIAYILKLDAIAYTINKFYSYGPTCYGKDNATKGNPSFFFVPLKVLYDVLKYFGLKALRTVGSNLKKL